MNKEDVAFREWKNKLPKYILKDFLDGELRPWFDSAYNLGWQDCYDECVDGRDRPLERG